MVSILREESEGGVTRVIWSNGNTDLEGKDPEGFVKMTDSDRGPIEHTCVSISV